LDVRTSAPTHTHTKIPLQSKNEGRTTLITDGLRTYAEASALDFPRTNHIKEIALDGVIHNNKMERMNGEVRDREKVMRGLKRTDTPILKGYQIYHNFVRPHEGLGGATPAEKTGIKVEGDDKWLTIIQNAAKKRLTLD
jgi:putative transposase